VERDDRGDLYEPTARQASDADEYPSWRVDGEAVADDPVDGGRVRQIGEEHGQERCLGEVGCSGPADGRQIVERMDSLAGCGRCVELAAGRVTAELARAVERVIDGHGM
jgi:hypothetical protein